MSCLPFIGGSRKVKSVGPTLNSHEKKLNSTLYIYCCNHFSKAIHFAGGLKFYCRFCGGKACSHENWKLQGRKSAIEGLNSDWITEDILACQRPSSRILREYQIANSFKENQIYSIFCL